MCMLWITVAAPNSIKPTCRLLCLAASQALSPSHSRVRLHRHVIMRCNFDIPRAAYRGQSLAA